jgi:hypothetical protein
MNKRNIIAELLIYIFPLNIKKLVGFYYVYLHFLIMFLGVLVILFSNNISYLLIILLVLCLDGLSNILFQDCPLTILEKKYSKISMSKLKNRIYKKLGINYKCKHIYENQLEIIINAICATTLKIFIILCCKIFSIKIFSY